MIKKVEVGKSYKLIDKEGFFAVFPQNKARYVEFFKDDIVTIDTILLGNGYIGNTSIIGATEYRFFEEYEVDLTIPSDTVKKSNVFSLIEGGKSKEKKEEKDKPTPGTPMLGSYEMGEDGPMVKLETLPKNIIEGLCNFSDLSQEDIYFLVDFYIASHIIQEYSEEKECWVDMNFNKKLCFYMDRKYRIKPEVKRP